MCNILHSDYVTLFNNNISNIKHKIDYECLLFLPNFKKYRYEINTIYDKEIVIKYGRAARVKCNMSLMNYCNT